MNIKEFSGKIDNMSMNLYFCERKRDKDKVISYSCYNITLTDEVEDKIRDMIKNIIKRYEDSKIVNYNPAGNIVGEIEECDLNDYKNVKSLMNSFDKPAISKNVRREDINFITYEFINDSEKILFLSKYKKVSVLKKGIIGTFFNNKFEKLNESNMMAIDYKIDLIIYKDKALILNHNQFESIFDLDYEIQESARSFLDNEKLKTNICNFEKMKEDILESMSYTKRIHKLNFEKYDSLAFLTNKEEVKEVLEIFNLNIHISDDKYIYEGKEHLGEFINLMQDAYYKTLIGKQLGVDERR